MTFSDFKNINLSPTVSKTITFLSGLSTKDNSNMFHDIKHDKIGSRLKNDNNNMITEISSPQTLKPSSTDAT